MSDGLRQSEPIAEEGVGWKVYHHLADLEIADPTAVERMTAEQRAVFALNTLRTEVGSDGFDGYFRYTYGDTAQSALEATGLIGKSWTAVVAEACGALGTPYPPSGEDRWDILDHLDSTDSDFFGRLDERLYQLEVDEPADEKLDAFVWKHKSAFFTDRA